MIEEDKCVGFKAHAKARTFHPACLIECAIWDLRHLILQLYSRNICSLKFARSNTPNQSEMISNSLEVFIYTRRCSDRSPPVNRLLKWRAQTPYLLITVPNYMHSNPL